MGNGIAVKTKLTNKLRELEMSIADSENEQITLFTKAVARTKSLADTRYKLIELLDDPEQKLTWPEEITFRQLAARIVSEKIQSLQNLRTHEQISDDVAKLGSFIGVARGTSPSADKHRTVLKDNYPYAREVCQNIDKLILEDRDVFKAFTEKEQAVGVTRNLEQAAFELMGTPRKM